ncbi:serine/threonine kinase [Schistosoma mansoni]|uniref:serine/threonine kinase n=1 Tax=Schistosoma mansoni TaxID=6183 RepID=UPI00022DC1E4|nr:serine/threonine kinase [Schistosoma mansoni]|eukprot:XP_018648604.1 serine/threonine kinase [Schistosoma mansoni]
MHLCQTKATLRPTEPTKSCESQYIHSCAVPCDSILRNADNLTNSRDNGFLNPSTKDSSSNSNINDSMNEVQSQLSILGSNDQIRSLPQEEKEQRDVIKKLVDSGSHMSDLTLQCMDNYYDDDDDALLAREFNQEPVRFEGSPGDCESGDYDIGTFSLTSVDGRAVKEESIPLFARYRPSPPPPLSRGQILFSPNLRNQSEVSEQPSRFMNSECLPLQIKGYSQLQTSDLETVDDDNLSSRRWFSEDEACDVNQTLYHRVMEEPSPFVGLSTTLSPIALTLDTGVITSSSLSLSSALSRVAADDQVSLRLTTSSSTRNSASTNPVNSPPLQASTSSSYGQLSQPICDTRPLTSVTYNSDPVISSCSKITLSSHIPDDPSISARQRLMGASAAAAILAASAYAAQNYPAKLNNYRDMVNLKEQDVVQLRQLPQHSALIGDLCLNPPLLQIQSNSQTAVSSLRRRDPWSIPLRKMSINLIQTYKHINEVYYRKKRRLREQQRQTNEASAPVPEIPYLQKSRSPEHDLLLDDHLDSFWRMPVSSEACIKTQPMYDHGTLGGIIRTTEHQSFPSGVSVENSSTTSNNAMNVTTNYNVGSAVQSQTFPCNNSVVSSKSSPHPRHRAVPNVLRVNSDQIGQPYLYDSTTLNGVTNRFSTLDVSESIYDTGNSQIDSKFMPVTLSNVWLPTSSSGATATHISRPLLLESGKSVPRDQRDPRGSTNQRDTEPHSTHLQHILPYQSLLPSKTGFSTYMEQNPLSPDNNIRSKNSSQVPLYLLSTTEARNISVATTEGFYQNQSNVDITKPINPHHSISFPVGNFSSSNCAYNNSLRSSACYYNLTPLDSISPTNSRIPGMFLNTHQHTANMCPVSHSQNNNFVSTSVTPPSYMSGFRQRFDLTSQSQDALANIRTSSHDNIPGVTSISPTSPLLPSIFSGHVSNPVLVTLTSSSLNTCVARPHESNVNQLYPLGLSTNEVLHSSYAQNALSKPTNVTYVNQPMFFNSALSNQFVHRSGINQIGTKVVITNSDIPGASTTVLPAASATVQQSSVLSGSSKSSIMNSSTTTSTTTTHHVDRRHTDSNYDYIVRPGEVWMGQYLINNLIGKGSFGQVGQMMKIIEVLGMPPRLLLEKSRRWHVFFERTVDRTYVPKAACQQPGSRRLSEILGVNTGGPRGRRLHESGHTPMDYSIFLEFVLRMLTFDPARRISPAAALGHRFFRRSNSNPVPPGANVLQSGQCDSVSNAPVLVCPPPNHWANFVDNPTSNLVHNHLNNLRVSGHSGVGLVNRTTEHLELMRIQQQPMRSAVTGSVMVSQPRSIPIISNDGVITQIAEPLSPILYGYHGPFHVHSNPGPLPLQISRANPTHLMQGVHCLPTVNQTHTMPATAISTTFTDSTHFHHPYYIESGMYAYPQQPIQLTWISGLGEHHSTRSTACLTSPDIMNVASASPGVWR